MAKTVTIRVKDEEGWSAFLQKLESEHGTSKGHIGPTIEQFAKDYTNDNISDINPKEYNRLLMENKSLIEDNKNIQQELNDYKNSIQDNDNKSKEQLQQLEHENKILSEKLISIQTNHEDMEARYEKTSHENKDYNNEITNLKKQISNLEKENKILDTGNANYEKTIKQLQQQIDNLNTSIDRLESVNTRQKKEITTSRNDYKHSVEVSNKLQRDLNGLHDEKNKFMFLVGQIQSMSLMDRMLKKYPKEVRELNPYNGEK